MLSSSSVFGSLMTAGCIARLLPHFRKETDMAVQSKKPVAPKASAKVAAKKEPTAKAEIAKVKKNSPKAETKTTQAEKSMDTSAKKVVEKKSAETSTKKPAQVKKTSTSKKAVPAKKPEVKKPQPTKAPASAATPKVTEPKEKTSRDMVAELLQENASSALLASHRPATPPPAAAAAVLTDFREEGSYAVAPAQAQAREGHNPAHLSAPEKKREVPPPHSAPGTVSMTRVLSRLSGQGESDKGRDLPRFKLR